MEVDSEISSPKDIIKREKKVSEDIVDATTVKVSSKFVWLCTVTEPENSQFSHQTYQNRETY